MTLRPFRAEDCEQVERLESVLFRVPYDEPWSAAIIGAYARYSHLHGWVAEDDGVIIGYLLATIVLDEANIDNLGVDPTRQRTGVARRLLEHAIEQFREHGVRHVWLEVAVPNEAARAFYLAAGFEQVDQRRNYYHGSHGISADALILTKAL
ncbi:MAG TPA: ribosomal-protein-alanine N-acetyltransferase [Firmicutes bacterium]|nr:ribosomal-protein-alanine N-acetyltransferase [Bacillota bacterium]